jgi:hypothetical protein
MCETVKTQRYTKRFPSLPGGFWQKVGGRGGSADVAPSGASQLVGAANGELTRP